jgi:hypothetical protein
MRSIIHDKKFSGVEVTHITKHGLWLLTGDNELFISFKEFPHFQDATVSEIMNVTQPTPDYLYWPDLDRELAVESVRCFPLVSNKPRPTTRSGRQAQTRTYQPTKKRSALSSHQNVTQRTEHDVSEDSARS